MAALWRRGPLGPRGLVAEVRAAHLWGEATVKTLLGRLMRKGAIRSERTDEGLIYRPLLTRADYLDDELQQLLDRLFEGSPERLAEHLSTVRGVRLAEPPDDQPRVTQP